MSRAPEVSTSAGIVRGRWEHDVAVFRGIPYAQPPFGARRFAAPVPARPWEGVRQAVDFGPSVPQAASYVWSQTGDDAGDSDCLTLNVWSPDPGAARLPVRVWIHGGAYLHGTSADPRHDGSHLAGSGAVVVSMNYRIGVEGFAHIAGAPDNRWILDQAAALRWVQANATAFGGDPDNVTVFGQSAGAGSIAALLAMPAAFGLFRRAIAQSIPGTYLSPDLAAVVSETIAAELGVKATTAEMAGIAPRALIAATATVIERMPQFLEPWGLMALSTTPFSPVVDGGLLPQAPWQALAGGAARDIDLLVGHTRDEYRPLAARLGSTLTDEHVTATLRRLTPSSDSRDGYRTTYPNATPAQLYELVNSDWLLRMPSLHLAEAQLAGGGAAWIYELRWTYAPDVGASHGLDVPLVFGTINIEDVRSHPSSAPNAAEEALHLAHHMRADWLSFASGQPGWAPYDPTTRATRVYNTDPITLPYPEEGSRRIWHRHRFDTLDLPG